MFKLLQFRHSPYNEKVRWALDFKCLRHERKSLLPGPHILALRGLTGRTHTPVLLHDGEALDGSARIVDWLEARYPLPPLWPTDAALAMEARRIQSWFDDDLTPRIRRVVLDTLLRQPAYFAQVFGDGLPVWKQRAYGLIVPLAAPLVRKGNGIRGVESVADGIAAGVEALDFVAERSARTGYLVGDGFSMADLTAASCLAPIVRPVNSPMASPLPVAGGFAQLMERYSGHPGVAWVRHIYARHRGSAADFDGPSPDYAATSPCG